MGTIRDLDMKNSLVNFLDLRWLCSSKNQCLNGAPLARKAQLPSKVESLIKCVIVGFKIEL